MNENDTPKLRPYPQHPTKSLDVLSAKLIDNGLSGVSQELLKRRIEQAGYFRLKGYWYPFLTPVLEQPAKRSLPFRQGTQFQDIWDRYLFDQELRMLVFDGIVTIEIYLKSFLAHELSVFGGEFGYMTREGLPGLSYATTCPAFPRYVRRSPNRIFRTSGISGTPTAIRCLRTG
ncbi:Abi family protein [Bifidobacterium myosotis]|nr:Abi family protein [Bifidobacterium myosotis]